MKEKDSIEFEQTEDLIKFGSEKSKLVILISVFIAFSIFITVHALYSIYDQWTDKSIPLTICPKSFENDSPVIMTPINQTDKTYVQDRWIRGFVRKIVLNSYPRTPEDASKFFDYMASVSEGSVQKKYLSFIDDIESIQAYMKAGNSIRFYPKNSAETRIRLVSPGKWVVEIDGFLLKNQGGGQERSTPTLRYVVEARPATRQNPNGLVIVESNTDLIADYVSGRKIEEEKKEK